MSKRSIEAAAQELCMAFPHVESVQAHGSPNYKVGGKTFAIYALNHHGDGHVALWLAAAKGAQEHYPDIQPMHYFVPPYVGHKGWLGVELNGGIEWPAVCERVYEAYCVVAPSALAVTLAGPPDIAAPNVAMKAEDINPFLKPKIKKVLKKLASLCEELPETQQIQRFGNPAWQAGKKTFVCVHYYQNKLGLQFWVGRDQQSLLTMDDRFTIPAYTGGNGWIDLSIEQSCDWAEIESLLLESYRHFALKRMLKLL